MRFKWVISLPVLFLAAFVLYAQDLSLTENDLWITQGADGGFHLFIRKKPDIRSVLLTETTKDPSYQEDNYAYRATTWNAVNGNEMRLLNGNRIPQTDQIYSLIDSTPEYIEDLGFEVFHIYIPYLLEYGYPTTRHGEVYVGNGTYFNIRCFELPYSDYRGTFADNSFILEVTQEPLKGPAENNYMKDAEDAYTTIADMTGGTMVKSRGPSDLVETIGNILDVNTGYDADIVFCLDTTASMENDIEAIRTQLVPLLTEIAARQNIRIGFVFFKDYLDDYVTQVYRFSSDMSAIQRTLNGIRARGGRDIPEAVYEALFDAATKFPWSAPDRKIILIGDAPPHPRPRGRISGDAALRAAGDHGIKINAILLPQ